MPQSHDRYEVCFEGIPSSAQEEWLLDFYAPILGLRAISIYLALRNEPRQTWKTHGDFFLRYQVTEGEFANALSGLEAMGLIATYLQKGEQGNSYVYALYCPRSPKSFLGQELMAGTLRRYVSAQEFDRLVAKYKLDPLPKEGFENASTKFFEYFQDNDNAAYYTPVKNVLGESSLALRVQFDFTKFFVAVNQEEPYIHENSFNSEEKNLIRDLAGLYAYDEESMASLVIRSFQNDRPWGSKLDRERLRYLCAQNEERPYFHREKEMTETSHVNGDSAIAEVVRAMERSSCSEFLSSLQGGGKPAPKEVEIANSLVTDMGLTNGQANAVIFYLLKVKENPTLTATWATNLAAAVLRSGGKTALDAFNYLIQTAPEKRKSEKPQAKTKPVPSKQEQKPTTPVKEKTAEEEMEVSDEDYAAFLKDL